MRIGKKVKEVTEEPRPYKAPIFPMPKPEPLIPMEPYRMPEKVPVPARRSQLPLVSNRDYSVEEIPYRCPFGGEELILEDGVFYCLRHGVIYA